ncbi:MAG: hypothetical protein IKP28_03340 [Clostridia bacterium]|nr:hypothetical protein [Clostridia bacterium]
MNVIFENKKRIINAKNNWNTCPKCNTQFKNHNEYKTCTNCGYNFKMKSTERLSLICDEGTFQEIDKNNKSDKDSIIIGVANITGYKVAIGIMDSFNMAGSIGKYLIDKLCYLIYYAKDNHLPLIIFSASGGIRVQEGVTALVGMSKLSEAINDYKKDGLFISFLTNATYGGLNASLSMLGDIILSEKDCKIGFSGARVIENELHQNLPADFQTTEFNYGNGLIDIITRRDSQKCIIGRILEQYYNNNNNVSVVDRSTKQYSKKIDKLELLKDIRTESHARPYEIVQNIFESFIEIHGDRISKDDNSIKCGFAKLDNSYISVAYVDRRNDINENIKTNFGMINPEGYRKVNRFVKLSEKMNSPIVFFVDTPGANAGYEAEKNGQASAIANLLQDISKIKVPIISFITGEANSGGAVALVTGDYLVMLEHSYLSVISPEAYIDIIYKGKEKLENVIDELRILPTDMLKDGIIDEIIEDNDFDKLTEEIKAIINNKITELSHLKKDELIKNRIQRIKNWGEHEQ